MTTTLRAFAVATALMMAGSPTGALAQAPRSTTEGVFTAEQAKAGEEAYQSNCAGCHGLDLKKTDAEAPDLTEGPFRFGWHGKTIAERFQKTRDTMPKAAVRSLPDQTYLDIVAYILSFNGVPAGSEKLTPDMAKLEAITIELPQAKGGGGRRR